MKLSQLFQVSSLVATVCTSIAISAIPALANPSWPYFPPNEICTFESKESRYAKPDRPPTDFSFSWNTDTGEVTSYSWYDFVIDDLYNFWFSFAADPGTVKSNGGYYNLVRLGTTTKGFEFKNYTINGYLAPNFQSPNYTFAGIFEGTTTAWFVAYGTVSCTPA